MFYWMFEILGLKALFSLIFLNLHVMGLQNAILKYFISQKMFLLLCQHIDLKGKANQGSIRGDFNWFY